MDKVNLLNYMRCTVCNSDEVKFLVKPNRGGSVFKCNKCFNAFTYPPPKINYERKQFILKSEDEKFEYILYAQSLINFFTESIRKGKLLDIGCGSGYLIEEAKKRGFQGEGLDPSYKAVKFCQRRNLKVWYGLLEEKYYPSESFDIVIASHVLEHVSDPIKFLNICRKILKKNGYLCLAQTNYTGMIPFVYGRYWEGWVPNEHFVHFCPFGIQFLLNKSGFEVKKIKTLPLGYHLCFKLGDFSTLANNLYYSISYILSHFTLIPFIHGDQMYILAGKVE